MRRLYLFVFSLLTSTICFASDGALPGEFSVSATLKVHFSKGNLQYQASTQTWRFAQNQYTSIGNGNLNASSTYTGWIDLFAWGSSGYKIAPYIKSTTESTFYIDGDKNKSIAGTNYDWGAYIGISNGGGSNGLWRTLTKSEWQYLLGSRANAASKYSLGKVAGVYGLILLPDNWTLPSGCTFKAKAFFDKNVYTATVWKQMEQAGAVFLPCCGFVTPTGTIISRMSPDQGSYWSSTACNGGQRAYFLNFIEENGTYVTSVSVKILDGTVGAGQAIGLLRYRKDRNSIRLVQDKSIYDNPTFTITTSATNGTVTGGGTYIVNATATLTATPNTCYDFSQWSDGNTDNPRTITVTGNATYTAEFIKSKYTIQTQTDNASQGTTMVEQ